MDLYLHVKVLFGMIVGLSVAHLLKGVASIVQHPKRFRVYWVHLVWVLFLFLYLIHFWWWEFNLARVREWTFPLYFFVALYAVLLYLLAILIKRPWFHAAFAIFALLYEIAFILEMYRTIG